MPDLELKAKLVQAEVAKLYPGFQIKSQNLCNLLFQKSFTNNANVDCESNRSACKLNDKIRIIYGS